MKIVAAILAGGRASRLGGIAKGLLGDAVNVTWIERLISELAEAGIGEVVLSANDPQPYARFEKTIIADLHTNVGPLGGIEAVLQHLAEKCDAVLFAPCDLPNFSAPEMRALIQAYASEHSLPGKQCIAMIETADNQHPLCAVVPTAAFADVAKAIAQGQYSAIRLWKTLGLVTVRIADSERLLNVNTPQELRCWRVTAR